MRNNVHHLKDHHILWGLKIVPRRKIRPTSSIHLPPIPRTQDGLHRYEILPQSTTDTESDSSPTDVSPPVQVFEILPNHPNSIWNSEPVQKFSIGRSWQEDNLVEHALRFIPPDSEEGKVVRLSSPFEGFELDPNHPNGLNFETTIEPICEQLLESPDPEYAKTYNEKLSRGPSRGPGSATPPYKRHTLYRYNRSSILPVPDHYEPGPVRKINWTRFSPSREEYFFDLDAQNRALDIIKAKQIYEAFRNQSIAHGNSYYIEWESRQRDLRRNIENNYKWDLATRHYFSELQDYDLGRIPDRPKPILLIGESVTHLLLSGPETPISEYDYDPMDDERIWPDPPVRPLPFWGQVVRPHLWALRNRVTPTFIPGGYLFHATDVRAENGQVYWVREMEFAPLHQFQAPAIDSPGSPFQEGVLSEVFTTVLHPPPVWVAFEGEKAVDSVLWPSDAQFQIEWKSAQGHFLDDETLMDKETLKEVERMDKNPSDILAEELAWGRGVSDDFFITAFGQILFAQAYPGLSEPYREEYRRVGVEPYGTNEEGVGVNYNLSPRVRETREPIRVNPYRSLANRRDWYYWFVRRRRILKWLYVIRQRMVLNEASYDSVELTFFEVLCEWYKWKPPPVPVLPPNKTKIAVFQLNCSENKDDNISTVLQFLKVAADKHASMVFLPECFDFVGSSREETLELSESVMDGYIIRRYQDLAQQFGVWMSLGGFHEKSEDEVRPDGLPWIRNSHLLLNPEGKIVSLYRKIHLFDVDIPEKGLALTESSYVLPGSQLVLSPTTPIGRIGLGVCYDLRFPEFGMAYRAQGAHVLTFPSAFTIHTGRAHWETLIRTRAIENQCFVIAAAQAGEHNAKRSSYGHSMIVDPWGTILAQAEGSGPGVIFAEIDLAHLEKVRKEMPVISHKVPGIPTILANVNSTTSSGSLPSETFGFVETPQVTNIPSDPSPSRWHCTVPNSAQDDLQFFFGPIVAKYEIVFLENATARAFVNKKCVVPGHVLVSTKRVVQRVQDLSEDEICGLFLLVQRVEKVMESVHGLTSSTITVQDGRDSGQTVEHVHVHVLPRRSFDFEDNDTIYRELATHDKGPAVVWRQRDEMKEEAESLRTHILANFPQYLSNSLINIQIEPTDD